MKKFLCVFLLMSLCISSVLFAASTEDNVKVTEEKVLVVSWIWKTNDKIKSFRFKVNNNDPEYWDHYVDGTNTSYSIRGVTEGESYTLYIQQTYDGENWSETATSTIKATVPEENK